MDTWIPITILVLSFAIVVFFAIFITKRIGKSLASFWSLFGNTTQVRIVSFGVSTFLVPQMVLGPWNAAFGFVEQSISKGSSIAADVASVLTRSQPIGEKTNQIPQIVQAAGLGLEGIIRSLQFPVTQVILGIALWVLVGQLLSGSSATISGANLMSILSKVSSVTWQNSVLFLVLFGGAYLSIAAITAIPSLQKGYTPVDSDKTRLHSELMASQTYANKEKFLNSFKTDDSDPFAPIEELQRRIAGSAQGSTKTTEDSKSKGSVPAEPAKSGDLTPAQTAPHSNASGEESDADLSSRIAASQNLKEWSNQLNAWLLSQQQVRQSSKDKLARLRDAVFEMEDQALKTTEDQFNDNTAGNLGPRERIEFISNLVQNLSEFNSAIEHRLRNCVSSNSEKNALWNSRSEVMAQSLTFSLRDPNFTPFYMFQNQGITSNDDNDSCDPEDLPVLDIVTPRNATSDLGFYRFFAAWLISSGSLALASITGMLGSGLLGSAASTFIRQQKARSAGGPLVTDLAGIVIRGVSAAIVIFLAVQGGLNIFSTTTGEPNPYVLLCTCLIGAVFSEDVWSKAQEWMRKQAEDSGRKESSSTKVVEEVKAGSAAAPKTETGAERTVE